MRCSRAFCGIIAEALRAGALGERGENPILLRYDGQQKGVSSGRGFGRAREKPDFTAVRRAVKRGKLRVGALGERGETRFYCGTTGSKKG